MKKLIISLACLLGMCSCMKKDDLFDRDKVKEEANKNFPVENIDPEQDWNMAGLGTMTVAINEGTDKLYTIKVYTNNPLTTAVDTKLLAKKENVKDGESITLKFDIPLATKYVYVMKEDEIYNRSVKMVELSRGNAAVSWGITVQKRGAYTLSRTSTASYEKPSEEDFPTEIPATAKNYENPSNNGIYKIEGGTATLQWHTNAHIYIKGEVTLNGNQVANGTKIYVLEGSTLTLGSVQLLQGATISVGSNATLTAQNLSETGNLYSRGTITITEGIKSNGIFRIYNDTEGNLTIQNELSLTNNCSTVNLGNLRVGKLTMDSNTKLINETGASLNIIGVITTRNTTAEVWNNGAFTAKQFNANSGGCYVMNKCKMLIEENFDLDGAKITLDGGAYLKCESLNMQNTTVALGAKALLQCDNVKMLFGNTIEGIGDEKALFLISEKAERNTGLCVTYKGNLSIGCSNHFANEEYDLHYKLESNAEMREKNEFKIPEANEGCSPGFTEGNGNEGPSEDKINVYTCAFEDMTTEAGDYDMNDVVLKIETVPVDGKLKVSLVAAGAMKDLKVYYNGAPFFDDQEVHAALGGPAGTVLNTQGDRDKYKPAIGYIEYQAGKSLAEYVQFSIHDVKTGLSVDLPQFQHDFRNGDAPYGIFVPIDWDYPGEKEPITRRYTYFAGWAENKELYTKWYEEHSGTWPSGEYPYADK